MPNKYKYLLVIQQDWGLGWEDVGEYEEEEYHNWEDDVREFRLAAGNQARTRTIKRRELTDYGRILVARELSEMDWSNPDESN